MILTWVRSIMDATYVGEVDCGCYLSGRDRLWMLLMWVRSIMDATYVGEVYYGCYLRG